MSFRLIKCSGLSNASLSGVTSTMSVNPSVEQLIEALYNEYVWLCHDDFDPDEDATPEEYLDMLKEMTYDELIEETCTDDTYRLSEYLEAWG
jgi:hypothetical protein